MSKKRVVSKSAYVGYLGKKASLASLGSVFVSAGFFGILLAIALFIVLMSLWLTETALSWATQFKTIALTFGSCSLLGIIMCVFHQAGRKMLKTVEAMEKVVPLTQQTADQLPAEESLVRASSEPTQPAETILLRAAQSSAETPAEELLRE